MTATLDIAGTHLATILAILRRHLPTDTVVYAYGSRTTGHARRFSDLDLAIDAPLPLALRSRLETDFEESDLPWRVDIRSLADAPIEPGTSIRLPLPSR